MLRHGVDSSIYKVFPAAFFFGMDVYVLDAHPSSVFKFLVEMKLKTEI